MVTALQARRRTHAKRSLLSLLVLVALGGALAQPDPEGAPVDAPTLGESQIVPPTDDASQGAPPTDAESQSAPPTDDASQAVPPTDDALPQEQEGMQVDDQPEAAPPTITSPDEVPADGDAAGTSEVVNAPPEPRVIDREGPYLLTRDPDGVVDARIALPALAVSVEPADTDRFVVTLADDDDVRTLTIDLAEPDAATPFGTDPAIFRHLRDAAERVSALEVGEAARLDPTNPWLALAAWRGAPGSERSDRLVALMTAAAAAPFFETFPIAGVLLEEGLESEAAVLLDAATDDFVARNYDPRLVTHPPLREAYGLPDVLLADALDRGDLNAARRLVPYAWRFAAPSVPGGLDALQRYVDQISLDETNEDVALWRGRLRELQASTLSEGLDRGMLALANLGWWTPLSLVTTTLLLWLVLLAKVWRARTLLVRQRVQRGEPRRPLGRLWVARYASTTEKLVLITLLVLAGVAVMLADWNEVRRSPDVALQSGTFASDAAFDAVLDLPDGPHAAWLRGLAFVQRGDSDAAIDAWSSAGAFAPTLVNWAVSNGSTPDDTLLEAALELDPAQAEAQFLTGRGDDPSVWHATTISSEPPYVMPTRVDVMLAHAGDWRVELGNAILAPWRSLPAAVPPSFATWTWWVLLGGSTVLVLALTLNLFVPRPRLARNAPRTPVYHLGALLIPGSGHADELWGLLLLVPWSILGVDALIAWQTGGAGPLGINPSLEITVLVILWVVNLIGFTIELSSYRERMWRLQESNRDLAKAFGMKLVRRRKRT